MKYITIDKTVERNYTVLGAGKYGRSGEVNETVKGTA